MFLETKRIINTYTRASKQGLEHSYRRSSTIASFRCDNCGDLFERNVGHMDKRRLNNNYFHVCSKCDAKRFAQSKGVERRKIWNMSADTDLDISKI
jgi:predicted RNA-binding Zn-ribbon protein involved in translation (DUF1610 family)